jgi:hypothetical protein
LIVTLNLVFVIGETVTLFVGGASYISIMVYNGVWESCSRYKSNSFKDFLISAICSGIFTVVLGICYMRLGVNIPQMVYIAILFFIGITIIGFVVLRILAYCNFKRKG